MDDTNQTMTKADVLREFGSNPDRLAVLVATYRNERDKFRGDAEAKQASLERLTADRVALVAEREALRDALEKISTQEIVGYDNVLSYVFSVLTGQDKWREMRDE